jgi:hypothetical protein
VTGWLTGTDRWLLELLTHVMLCALCVLQGKLCWVLQCLAVLLGLSGVANRLANAQTLQVRGWQTAHRTVNAWRSATPAQ